MGLKSPARGVIPVKEKHRKFHPDRTLALL